MNFLGATTGILISSCIFGLDFDLFNPDEPAIQEPTMSDNLWNKPMMVGLTLAGIAIVAAVGFGCWKMLTTNEEIPNNGEEIPNDEPSIQTDDEDQTEPTVEIPNDEHSIQTDDEDQIEPTEEIPNGDEIANAEPIIPNDDGKKAPQFGEVPELPSNDDEYDPSKDAWMLTINEEIPNGEEILNDEPLIGTDDEDQTEPTINLRNRKVNRE